jgi:hypothetical protein
MEGLLGLPWLDWWLGAPGFLADGGTPPPGHRMPWADFVCASNPGKKRWCCSLGRSHRVAVFWEIWVLGCRSAMLAGELRRGGQRRAAVVRVGWVAGER